ncbi:hypothetical protein V1264_012864 [Littorina saxatilis]|uniref:Pyridoxal-dependent decarboxylase domain-containing protein 1 n=2 Tax=Littorina saxatilis TaxID=31220 RepID=A0AAN9BYB0_9CAEN
MLNPMLDDMEKRVSQSTVILDRINKQMDLERKERMKKRLTSHVPEALQGGGESPESVLQKVEQLIFFAEIEGTDEVQLQEHVRLQDLDPVAKTALLANSLKAYLTTLPEDALKRVVTKINSDCQLWLSRLFRFQDSCVMYHDDEREGLVRICRLALYTRYPKYATDGFDALYSRPPVIYLSAAAKPGLGAYICQQLGLPLSCICTVPCNTVFGASSKMDVAMLEKLIQDDLAAAKTPVLLVAYAGTPSVGHVDNLQRLQEVCKTNEIWLHVEGCYLATLTLFSVPSDVSSAKSGDSITITPGTWLGIPGLPNATLFKTSDPNLMHAAGLNTFNTALKLNCLPYWMCLLTLGHQGLISRITHACDLAKSLYDKLDPITTIKQISRDKKESAKKKEYKSLLELLSKAISALLVFEMASPTVVFRYAEDTAGPGAIVAPYAVNNDDDQNSRSEDSIYYDSLNIWLAESMRSSDPKVPVETVDVDKEGLCIRYCPLENAQAKGTTKEDMEQFVTNLTSNLSVLNASTRQRKRFQAMVESQPNLKLIHLENWAGLGAVSYVPDVYVGRDDLGPADLIQINSLNAEVLHRLKAQDTAFSMGHTDDGSVCMKFGLITEDTDLEELVEMVQSTGKEVEESSKFLEFMSEMVRKGIDEANKELQKGFVTKLQHEGVLRQIPMVSSVMNWLSPIKEEIQGQSFNLTSGKIHPTQDTYKYHMQIQEDSNPYSQGAQRTPRTPRTSTSSGGQSEGGEGGSTTAGQVKAQLISQTPPSTPLPMAGPGLQLGALTG